MPEHRIRAARVGELLPPTVVGRGSVRVLDSTAILVPGEAAADDYVAALTERAADFGDWDGRLVVADPDGAPMHRLAIVDRYGQVYSVSDARTTADLPDAAALIDWFRFLATACPECGVIDDPIGRGWTP
ncbi:MAG TPA: hypothetical protein VF364_05815 [Candidatus Limnocylindria bacterium]